MIEVGNPRSGVTASALGFARVERRRIVCVLAMVVIFARSSQ